MPKKRLPELLCPAGTPEALRAAVEGGADAVYLGTTDFNARRSAGNFDAQALREGIALAHAYGVRVYVTFNTLVTDRELPAFLAAASDAADAGADAFLLADVGAAAALRRLLPGMPLHASTQLSGHSAGMAEYLREAGFTRMVCAREMAADDIRTFVETAGIEAEIFVHGALCVCHSGQCLFSSLVGGRSGNRGACAQPCRLPYATPRGRSDYPLSLKDLSLATRVPELLELGVHSLKIEGRMKAPSYVYTVASVWRRLLDEGRPANARELQQLTDAFSRGGFTDGYFTGRVDRSMLGVRSEQDKAASRAAEQESRSFDKLTPVRPLRLQATVRADEPMALTLEPLPGRSPSGAPLSALREEMLPQDRVTVTGAIPEPARTVSLTEELLRRNLTKFGGTPYYADELQCTLDEGLSVSPAALNGLRRAALAALTDRPLPDRRVGDLPDEPELPARTAPDLRTARVADPAQVTDALRDLCRVVYVPVEKYDGRGNGVVLPPVIWDSQRDAVLAMLKRAAARGAQHALAGNPAHLALIREAGLIPHGDFRLNVLNRESVRQVARMGWEDVLLGPEMTLPQLRDVCCDESLPIPCGVLVYGRIPLMVLEKCVGKELADCAACEAGTVRLRDRRGMEFPVLRAYPHRSVIYNSLPTDLCDRQEQLARNGIRSLHLLFSVETPREVDDTVRRWQTGSAPVGTVRRLPQELN